MSVANLYKMVSQETERFRHALKAGEFVLRYLPQVTVSRSPEAGARDPLVATVTGVEALVRWKHPERGMLPPATFLGLAEETGLIRPLGDWILRTACADAARWHAQRLPLTLSVNVSAEQIDAALPELVAQALAETGIDAARLTLELTSRRLFADDADAEVSRLLHALTDQGVSLSADDFGTGYNSLQYLARFPLASVKIDRSMVAALTDEESCAAASAVGAILDLARSCGIVAVAEGVETRDQRDLLFVQGCTRMQGYLFSAPVDAGAVPGLLGG
jgi:FOG: EAL domain